MYPLSSRRKSNYCLCGFGAYSIVRPGDFKIVVLHFILNNRPCRYEDILPQWKNLAVRLEVSDLRTKWIETCVRPSEGLTRYLLEVYMRDGGTLGEVLQGLLELGCLDILEMLKGKVRSFLDHRNAPETKVVNGKMDPKFFSILSTLANALGKSDPCADLMRRHSLGLKKCSVQADSHETHDQRETSVLVRGEGSGAENCDPNPGRDWPVYKPELHLKKMSVSFEKARRGNFCRILLLFADDGVRFSAEAYNMIQGFEHRGVVAEVFQLNESSLWYEMLVSPEACCMKWASEADYVVPILSPNVVREFHGAATAGGDGEEGGSLVPTSPLINRFMYTLLRSRYVDAGCRNEVVRAVMPTQHLSLLGASPAIKNDPLLRLVWIPLREEKVKARLRGMLAETEKKRSLS